MQVYLDFKVRPSSTRIQPIKKGLVNLVENAYFNDELPFLAVTKENN